MSDATDIQRRIDEVDGALIRAGQNANAIVLCPNATEVQQRREEITAELQRKRGELAMQLPVTGERAGHMVIGRTLGTVTVRECEPEVHITQAELDRDDPFLRFAAECGEDYR
jgi:hypothetical protein